MKYRVTVVDRRQPEGRQTKVLAQCADLEDACAIAVSLATLRRASEVSLYVWLERKAVLAGCSSYTLSRTAAADLYREAEDQMEKICEEERRGKRTARWVKEQFDLAAVIPALNLYEPFWGAVVKEDYDAALKAAAEKGVYPIARTEEVAPRS